MVSDAVTFLESTIDGHLVKRCFLDALPLVDSLLAMTNREPKYVLKKASILYSLQRYEEALHLLEQHAMYDVHLKRRAVAHEHGTSHGRDNVSVLSALGIGSEITSATDASKSTGTSAAADIRLPSENDVCRRDWLLLGAQCSEAIQAWKKCREYGESMLQHDDSDADGLFFMGLSAEMTGGSRSNVVAYYRKAVLVDPFNAKAMHRITSSHLLSPDQQRELILELRFPPEAECVRQHYLCSVPIATGASSAVASIMHVDDDDEISKGIGHEAALYYKALRHFSTNDYPAALAKTKKLLLLNPFNRDAVALHIVLLCSQRNIVELYAMCHTLGNRCNRDVLYWFAIGCYYYCQSKYEKAGRFFSRCTEVDVLFPVGWMALGHCYARLEESEQALDSYRKASTLFPGLQHCTTFLGMQEARAQYWQMAATFLEDSSAIRADDPLVLNEKAVLACKAKNYTIALHTILPAVEVLQRCKPSEYTDCVFFNTGTIYRKLRDYPKALTHYQTYVSLRPQGSHGHCALAMTHHIMGDLGSAIEHYMTALSFKPSDVFCKDLLNIALQDRYGRGGFVLTNLPMWNPGEQPQFGGGGQAGSLDGINSADLSQGRHVTGLSQGHQGTSPSVSSGFSLPSPISSGPPSGVPRHQMPPSFGGMFGTRPDSISLPRDPFSASGDPSSSPPPQASTTAGSSLTRRLF